MIAVRRRRGLQGKRGFWHVACWLQTVWVLKLQCALNLRAYRRRCRISKQRKQRMQAAAAAACPFKPLRHSPRWVSRHTVYQVPLAATGLTVTVALAPLKPASMYTVAERCALVNVSKLTLP